MLAVVNATLVMPDFLMTDSTVVIDGEKIIDFGKKVEIPEGSNMVDAKGLFVGPGLIDIHTHAVNGKGFAEAPKECSQSLFEHGVTSVMPALYFSLDAQGFVDRMDIIDRAVENGDFANFAGYYMEGPYMNPKFGSNRENNPWNGPIKREEYEPVLKKAGTNVRVWGLAPEREGILEFVKAAKAENPEVVFSVAHSEATPEQIEEIIPYGLKIGTHHTNATGTVENFPECRGVCVDETVNYNGDIYAELICDTMGIHVHPYMLRLVAKVKGRERLILISDASMASTSDGPPIPGCEEAVDIRFDRSGEIAGTNFTLDRACRNMLVHTGCSICDAFRYASTNPAKAVGLNKLGQIKKGNIANLVIVDHWFEVKGTIFKGNVVALKD